MDKDSLFLNANAKKFHGETSADKNVDRLSNLPEELINHIMSFLPMEDALKTDALSMKWKYRWTNTTHLLFYDYFVRSRKMTKKSNFLIFIERVLMLLGNQPIKSFSVECIKQYDAARVHTWITALVRRQVQKLKICCSLKESMVFPQCALDSQALDELHLTLTCTFKLPTSFCFSSLKILNLSDITILNTDFPQSRELSISFPLLQELSLWGCKWENVLRVNIDAPVLHSFSIGDFEYFYEPKLSRVIDCVLRIQGSAITKFNCGSHSFVYISLVGPLPDVTDATIELASHYLKREHIMGSLTCALLRQFSSLKSLTLSSDTIMALAYLQDLKHNLPQLHRTRHLTITGGTPVLSESLITLLRHLPCLVSLTVCRGSLSPEDDSVSGYFEECPLPFLKVVRFLAVFGRNDELQLAKFIMKNAEALEEITMTARGSRKDREKIIKGAEEELLSFPRVSAHASIKFEQIAE